MSKTEQILSALHTMLGTIPDVQVERNEAIPIQIPAGGLIIIRDGDPGFGERTLGGFAGRYYSHTVEIECYVQEADDTARDLKFDALLAAVDAKLQSDESLTGLVFGMDYSRPNIDLEPIEGAPAIKSGVIELTLEYDTTTPLT